MSNVHGWTALAGAVVALAGGATTAQAAHAAKPTPRPRPALAVGTSRDGSWRLEGRALTVRLRDRLDPRSFARHVELAARCGDGIVETAEPSFHGAFVTSAGRRGSFDATARVLRLRLSRDVAARATLCLLEVTTPGDRGRQLYSWMRLKRGRAPRCERTAAERTIFETLDVSVFARVVGEDDTYSSELLRACRRPSGRSVGLAENWAGGGGGGGGSETNDSFAAGGRWLAWVSAYRPNNSDREGSTSIVLRDLAGPVDVTGTVFDVGSDRDVYPSARIARVTKDGLVVWIASTRAPDQQAGGYARIESLHVGAPGGRSVELDRTTAGGYIDGVVLSADRRTLSWYDGGEPRSAPLPAP